jgi:hypothetical protein
LLGIQSEILVRFQGLEELGLRGALLAHLKVGDREVGVRAREFSWVGALPTRAGGRPHPG